MSEEGVSQEAELWLRYLRAGLPKWQLDCSALQRLCVRVQRQPDLNEMHAALLAEVFETGSEAEAVLGLAIAGAVVGGCRTFSSNSSDADFLSRLLKFSVPKFEANLAKGWAIWQEALSLTLLEWKQCYRIDSSLNSALKRLLQPKDRATQRDTHYTVLADWEAVDALLRRTPSEYVTLELLRVWEHSLWQGPAEKDVLSPLLLESWNAEGWEVLLEILRGQVKASSGSALFRTVQDKFTVLLVNFVKTHSAVLVERSVGASVRVLAGRSVRNIHEFLQTPAFRTDVEQLITDLKYTLESLHKQCPLLAKFLCDLSEALTQAKGEYWHELANLLVLRVLAPAVSNPVASGVVEVCGSVGMNVLKETARLLHCAWLGKAVESGELSEVSWVNVMLPQWHEELKGAYARMLCSKREEVKPLFLPRALVLCDLADLNKAFAAAALSVSRSPESPSPSRLKGNSLKPPLHVKKRSDETSEKETNPQPAQHLIPEVLEEDPVPFSKPPPMEESTPSVMALPVPTLRSFTVREIQTDACDTRTRHTQTHTPATALKATQTQAEVSKTESVQTEPESERFKLRNRYPDDVYIKDQATETVGSWEMVAAEKLNAEKELILLQQYRSSETQRVHSLNDYWGTQLLELSQENETLKKSIRDLREHLATCQQVTEEDLLNERSPQLDFQETMRSHIDEESPRRWRPTYMSARPK